MLSHIFKSNSPIGIFPGDFPTMEFFGMDGTVPFIKQIHNLNWVTRHKLGLHSGIGDGDDIQARFLSAFT